MKHPLDIDATVIGPTVELRYGSHGDAVRQLRVLREQLEQRDELLEALQSLYAVAQVDHDAEYEAVTNAAAVIAKVTPSM
jgi:hypothetical protein